MKLGRVGLVVIRCFAIPDHGLTWPTIWERVLNSVLNIFGPFCRCMVN